MKGEYDFAILVTCLLILALQIHNPFQSSRQSICQCGDGQSSKSAPSQGQYREQSASAAPPGATARGAAGNDRGRPAVETAPPVYRRPREAAAPVAKPGGLSTDELLRELDSIQNKAKEQQETLAAAGRMPPSSPILDQLRESEAAGPIGRGQAPGPLAGGGMGAGGMPPAAYPAAASQASTRSAVVPGAGPMASMPPAGGADAMLRSRSDFGRFLEARQPRGLGVVLGIGRGDFALRLMADWGSAQGLYLVDPFIHIWRGYDDPSNLNDRDHQVVFEELRNRLAPFEGRHVLVRDFSHSFAEVYRGGGQTPGPPTFIYIDANHAEQAVSRDLELWWPLLAPGGILAGSTYSDDAEGRVRVRTAVDRFAAGSGAKVYLTHDDMPPSWFIFKS